MKVYGLCVNQSLVRLNYMTCTGSVDRLSRVLRKTAFANAKTKAQISCALSDQRLCFRYINILCKINLAIVLYGSVHPPDLIFNLQNFQTQRLC